MNVISLDRARDRLRGARLRGPRRIEPPSALGVPARPAGPTHDDDEDRLRMRQNVAAFLAIVAIVGLGAWLMDSLHYYSRLQTCIEAGHRNCLPLATKYMASPYGRQAVAQVGLGPKARNPTWALCVVIGLFVLGFALVR